MHEAEKKFGMSKVMIKGGIWKNSEDEILKAAVMKYGLNNWSRIASLLVRKTPSQCKSRWYEWLDPSIKKIEWSKEEDEKLLHLAKVFPTQWRTIGPVVGRTAHQCQERYDRLLDEAQGRDMTMDEHDPRRLRPGEIDPAPETRPAKADPADMDDDEKAMLQEARARLANVQGKKAKRKEREAMMEETRRLAQLQKDRELRAAGLSVASRRLKRNDIDYTKEIPFEAPPQVGAHVLEATPNLAKNRLLSVQSIEGTTRRQEMQRHKKEDARTVKRLKETEMPFQKAVETVFTTDLVLPEPDSADSEDEQPISRERFKGLLESLPAVENEVEFDELEFLDEDEEEQKIDVDQPAESKSVVVTRALVRPKYTSKDLEKGGLTSEAARLALRDLIDFPLRGVRPFASSDEAADRSEFTAHELHAAKQLVEAESPQKDQYPPYSVQQFIPLTHAPAVRRLTAQVEASQKLATELVGDDQKRSNDLAKQLQSVYTKLAETRRQIRAFKTVSLSEEGNRKSHIEDMSKKLKNEKTRNKSLQDRYLRMTSFIRQMSNRK